MSDFDRAEECLAKMLAAGKACGYSLDDMRASLFYGAHKLVDQIPGGKVMSVQLKALALGTLKKKGKS